MPVEQPESDAEAEIARLAQRVEALSQRARRSRGRSNAVSTRLAGRLSDTLWIAAVTALAYFGAYIHKIVTAWMYGISRQYVAVEITDVLNSAFIVVLPTLTLAWMYLRASGHAAVRERRRYHQLSLRLQQGDRLAIYSAKRLFAARSRAKWTRPVFAILVIGIVVWIWGTTEAGFMVGALLIVYWLKSVTSPGISWVHLPHVGLGLAAIVGILNAANAARSIRNQDRYDIVQGPPEQVILWRTSESLIVADLDRAAKTFGPEYQIVPAAGIKWKSEKTGQLTLNQ